MLTKENANSLLYRLGHYFCKFLDKIAYAMYMDVDASLTNSMTLMLHVNGTGINQCGSLQASVLTLARTFGEVRPLEL